MSTAWLRRTNRGRVVYDRKPHAWGVTDIVRIARSSDVVFFNIPLLDWEIFQKEFQLWFGAQASEFVGFGGGVFAGGGATRSWEAITQEEVNASIDRGVIVIIRGEA